MLYGSISPHEVLFSCPTEGCIKKFHHEGNLARHVIAGRHKYVMERETAIDFVQNHYEDAMSKSNLQTIRRAQQAMLTSVPTELQTQPQGWALKVACIFTQFKPHQRKYLIDKFEVGESTGKMCNRQHNLCKAYFPNGHIGEVKE